MADQELLLAIGQLMDQKLEPINMRLDQIETRLYKADNCLDKIETRLDKVDGCLDKIEIRLDKVEKRLDKVDGDIEALKENTTVTRDVVNTILNWAEDASIQVIPLFGKKVK